MGNVTTRITTDRQVPGFWRVTLNHPPINTVDDQMYDEIFDLVEAVEAEPSLKVVTFESANPDYFLAHYGVGGIDSRFGKPRWIEAATRLAQSSVRSAQVARSVQDGRRGRGIARIDPPESLRRRWKVVRDCSRRRLHHQPGARRARPARARFLNQYIRPQRHHADMVVRFADPPDAHDDPDSTHLDAHLLLRPGLPHPDLSDVVGDDPRAGPLAGGRGRRAGPVGCRVGCRRRRRSSSKSGSG